MVMECISRCNQENRRRPLVIEIGCADGQGTQRYAGFCSKVICVDPMVADRPDIDSRKRGDVVQDLSPNQDKINLFRRRTQDFPIELVVGCSMWPDVIESVERHLAGRQADILVIDGCHHPFEAVWGDFDLYYRFVKKGGYIIFDDLYEECILQAYEKAIKERNMEIVDRFYVPPHELQDTAALRKTED
jgi:cephalosporin hydroxylase